jgi:hypothetical protein
MQFAVGSLNREGAKDAKDILTIEIPLLFCALLYFRGLYLTVQWE